MKDNEYQCALCKGIFTKMWTDEEAEQEFKETFSDFSEDDCEIVCDDCYKIIMKNFKEKKI